MEQFKPVGLVKRDCIDPVKISTVRSKYLNRCTAVQTCLHEGEHHRAALSGYAAQILRVTDHRLIKRRTRQMLVINTFESASRTLDSIEVVQTIRKTQFATLANGFEQFSALAGKLCPINGILSN